MTDSQGSAVAPPIVEWRFRNARAGEERTYQQTELSIEGEARLVSLAARVGEVLRGAGYSWAQLGDMLDREDVGLDQLLVLISDVAPSAPDLITDTACIMLSLYPTDEFGKPDPDFDEHRFFIRRTINITRFADMVQVLLSQNDYQRLIRPFSRTLASAMGSRGGPASDSAQSPDGYSQEPVELMDDSTEPVETLPKTTKTRARTRSATATPSES